MRELKKQVADILHEFIHGGVGSDESGILYRESISDKFIGFAIDIGTDCTSEDEPYFVLNVISERSSVDTWGVWHKELYATSVKYDGRPISLEVAKTPLTLKDDPEIIDSLMGLIKTLNEVHSL